ncbi:glycosyltransferase [candidate division WWE3 bacterium]|uniref:Glycosyltransferase n=1 Tax=candidate division WWE3 bacterium TaxID=2053526 RepID=A0A955EC74_UNCKA|nr:glycosyltransferase [candidate division WWE3 bacterium]
MTDYLDLTIVVPTTKDRSILLYNLVDSLDTTKITIKEIIVIGHEELDIPQSNHKIRYIKVNVNNASIKRNTGIKNACTDYILFIDDDCYVKGMFLDRLVRVLKKHEHKNTNAWGFALNVVRDTSTNELDIGYLKSGMDHYFKHTGNKGLVERFEHTTWAPTAGLIVRKDAIKKSFPINTDVSVGGEDVIFGWENSTANRNYLYCLKEINVYHVPITHSNIDILKHKAYLYGKSEYYIWEHLRGAEDIIKYISVKRSMKELIYAYVRYPRLNIEKTLANEFIKGTALAFIKKGNWPLRLSLTKLATYKF